MRRPILLLLLLLLGITLIVVGAYFYFQYRTPPGVTPQSDNAEILALIGLGSFVVGLLTAIVGLLNTIAKR